LHCVIDIGKGLRVNVFNVHLGTGYLERRKQI
jgi:endonuclease/exonuclease/phosphatase family metal-dependent hydrolase